jgi:hypothetical protein
MSAPQNRATVIVRIPSFTKPDVRYRTRAYVLPGTYTFTKSIRDAKGNLWLQSTSGAYIVAESNGKVYARIESAKQVEPDPAAAAKRAAYLAETARRLKEGAAERAAAQNPWQWSYLKESAQEWEARREERAADFRSKAAVPGSRESLMMLGLISSGARFGIDGSSKSSAGDNGVFLTFVSVGILTLGSLLGSMRT